MDRYVVIGNPVAHSQSPFIHAEFARQTGHALTYDRLLAPASEFAATLQRFADEGGLGCNVTVPFKFEAFHLTAARTQRAELAGACNTLRRHGEGWFGDNTDGIGLVRDIEGNAGVALRGLEVLMIGAGGAAAGALGPLLEAAPARLVIANRTPERALALVRAHRRGDEQANATDLSATDLAHCGSDFDVVINASASSLAGAAVPVAPAVLAPDALAVDMMYGAAAQGFLGWAERHGARARDGLGMLVEQAAAAFEFFRGVAPQTGPVLDALRLRLSHANA